MSSSGWSCTPVSDISMDSTLVPTAKGILDNVSKLRILVVGKPGCGKSALISKVFGVDPSPETAELTENDAVYVRIMGGLTYHENSRFILYTSQDFLPNSDSDFDEIRGFIQQRLNTQDPKQELHAVLVCMDTPHVGERLSETGVERILEVTHKKIPLIIVFTKFDHLVNTFPRVDSGNDHEANDPRELATKQIDDTVKKFSLDSLLSKQLITHVSTIAGFEDTVSTLIQFTDAAIQKLQGKLTHALPKALAWATAQRQDPETTVAAIIDVGREGSWSGLGSTTEFKGRTLEECLSVIHSDIVTIWNIQDSFSYLEGDDFKARLSHLAEDLAYMNQSESTFDVPTLNTVATFAVATANPIATIGTVAEPAKWVSDVYQVTPGCIACVMGYIVDLVLVLSFLSEIRQLRESALHTIEEDAVDAIKEYVSSEVLGQVHKEIREFVAENQPGETGDGRDIVFGKLERLVKFHKRAREVVDVPRIMSSPAISVTTVSDDGVESYIGEKRALSHERRPPSPKPRRGRGSVQEGTPDILTIVEEASKVQVPRSSFERLTLSIPDGTPSEGTSRSPLPNFLSWLRREPRHMSDEETGKD